MTEIDMEKGIVLMMVWEGNTFLPMELGLPRSGKKSPYVAPMIFWAGFYGVAASSW